MKSVLVSDSNGQLRDRFLSKGFFIAILVLTLLAAFNYVEAQSTSFSYQGKLADNGIAANGTYDIEFRLFDVASGGSTLAVQQKLNVQVADGVFAVQLDYGAASFNGSARYIEIGVRPAGGGSFTAMSPRSLITSTPYSVKSLTAANADTATNATQLGGLAANSFVQTSDSRLTDARSPVPGSASYIQNTSSPQASSSFNITGIGTASILNVNSQFNLGGNRMLSAFGTNNIYVGLNAGNNLLNSGNNSFFGASAGQNNTGTANSFFGMNAGLVNSTGSYNTFFGSNAGAANTTSINNAFFGQGAGLKNTAGHDNTFLGNGAGLNVTTANNNTMVGSLAGQFGNGANNTFVGTNSGGLNSGSGNTYLGYAASGGVSVNNATAVGANASVAQSNSVILGSISGVNGATANASVGIGTTSPNATFHVSANNSNMLVGDPGCGSGYVGIGFRSTLSGCQNYSLMANDLVTIINGVPAVSFRTNNVEVAWINQQGTFAFENPPSFRELGSAQYSVELCVNAVGQPSNCSSSLRYKKELQPFTNGLALLEKLDPIRYKWKSDDRPDLGFGAEDVAKVEPLLVVNNKKGEVEGVRYDRISVLLVDAVKEQQTIIQKQQQTIEKQGAAIAALRTLVCRTHRRSHICRER